MGETLPGWASKRTPRLERAARACECRPCSGNGRFEFGDLLVCYLEALGIDYVFGVPGGGIEPLYNALARAQRRGGLRSVVARHESGAAFMADGYARETGKPGVCCATTGPGATNLITGVAAAFENRVPLLVITAQSGLCDFGRGAFQESSCTGVDTVAMFKHVTRYSTLVSHVDQFERKLLAALVAACQGEPGPAHLSIPRDLLRQPAPTGHTVYDLAALLRKPDLVDKDAVADLCSCLEAARRVVFVLGEGCADGVGVLLEVASCIGANIVTTPHGKGLVSPFHPLYRGVVGFAGHAAAREAVKAPDVDTVVLVGSGLSEWASEGWDTSLLLNERLVHVDSVQRNMARSPMARLHVYGRIRTIFENLLCRLGSQRSQPLREIRSLSRRPAAVGSLCYVGRRRHFRHDCESACLDDSAPIKPQRLMRELTRLFPVNTRFHADTGNSIAWAIHYLHPAERRMSGSRGLSAGLFRGCFEFAPMGWAIGASIGAALADARGPVVCITGDGSVLMNGQELTVAVQLRLPVVFVVLNDSALGMVKHGQRLARAERVGCELPAVDYSAYAAAVGAQGQVIRSPHDMQRIDVAAICARSGPTVLDVRIDPEEVPPIQARMKVLVDGL